MSANCDVKGLMLVLCMWACGCGAAQGIAPPRYRLTIASQPLSDALQEFARQSGIQVIFFSRITDGLRAPALEGQYTATAALAILLADSKLTFRMVNPKTVEIRPPAKATEPARPSPPARTPAARSLLMNGTY